MRKAILALVMAGLANTGGVALAAPDPAKAAFQAEVCSVLAQAPRIWQEAGDEAAQKRVGELSMSYERGWTEVRLGWKAGRSSCRKPAEVDFLQVTADRSFAQFSHRNQLGSIDCYYERQEGRWRQIACSQNVIIVN
jgi:hypothetical protein